MFIKGTGSVRAFGPPRYLLERISWYAAPPARGERDGQESIRAKL